jgi:aldehyde dehydrogenase (NAD+)
MEAAAKNLTSVTLELGGKSPMIIDATADLELSARKLVWGKCFNAGQTCIAPDYVLIESSVHDRFVEMVKSELNERITTSGDIASIINRTHHARLQGLIADAVAHGATAHRHEVHGSDTHLDPVVLTGVTDKMNVMTEEIFGPIILIQAWTDEAAMVAHIRALPDPLALYIFSKDRAFADRVIARTSAGATCINDVMAHFSHPNLPFGGVNGSGIGKSHGEYGFVAFSNERAILKPRFGIDGFKILLPPYGKGIAKAIRAVIKK